MESLLNLIGRTDPLFEKDLAKHEAILDDAIRGSKVLVIGGAGSIGQNVVKEIFKRHPAKLHVVDISENNLVELVRDIRSTLGYINGESAFLPIDMASAEFESFFNANKPYDYVFNLAALKHVRSEKDEYSLMRMIKTNILFTEKTCRLAAQADCHKYFAVSTDKAENPANLMGATKRIMEVYLSQHSSNMDISTARFANVAFSDGSLLHGFTNRLSKLQPLSAPRDIRRYFMTGRESGLLCLFSAVMGKNQDIYFPKLDAVDNLITFSQIAERFLAAKGFEAVQMESEQEARDKAPELISKNKWPCFFFSSDTSGEKPFEEFYRPGGNIDMGRYADIGVINGIAGPGEKSVLEFISRISKMESSILWSKGDLVDLIKEYCWTLNHLETGKNLDRKM